MQEVLETLEIEKETMFLEARVQLQQQGFRIEQIDDSRPWGGFFVIDEAQAKQFAELYFGDLATEDLCAAAGRLSPKLLLVAPQQRLSWQYHHRRAEIWRVVRGPVGIVRSPTDAQPPIATYAPGDTVTLQQGERHRLVGLDGWGIVAELWQHTNAAQPSDEADIVRVQDDFGR